MPLRDVFYPLLAIPSPDSWLLIVKALDDGGVTSGQLAEDARELAREFRAAWPREVARPRPRHWLPESHGELIRALCVDVRETDLYRLYIDGAANARTLQLRDGAPAVRLQRAFTGMLGGAHGRAHRIGVKGQGDLTGSLCVEWLHPLTSVIDASGALIGLARPGYLGCAGCRKVEGSRDTGGLACGVHGTVWRRVSVGLEVEVKTATGRTRPEQLQRAAALRTRGEIHLIVRRIDEMVLLLVAERQRILAEIGQVT